MSEQEKNSAITVNCKEVKKDDKKKFEEAKKKGAEFSGKVKSGASKVWKKAKPYVLFGAGLVVGAAGYSIYSDKKDAPQEAPDDISDICDISDIDSADISDVCTEDQ